MKAGEFFTMSAIMALIFSIVIFFESSITGIGLPISIALFIYFIAVIMIKGMWGLAGKADDLISGVNK